LELVSVHFLRKNELTPIPALEEKCTETDSGLSSLAARFWRWVSALSADGRVLNSRNAQASLGQSL
jgi:hypothetical protein